MQLIGNEGTLEHLREARARGDRLCFSRFGDGELSLMSEDRMSHGHQAYDPDLDRRLHEVWDIPGVSIGIQQTSGFFCQDGVWQTSSSSKAWQRSAKEMNRLQARHPDKTLYSLMVFANAIAGMRSEILLPVFRGPLFVVGKIYDRVDWKKTRLEVVGGLTTPDSQSWSVYPQLMAALARKRSSLPADTLFMVATGIAGSVLVVDLMRLGFSAIDAGSMVDPLSGVPIRRYQTPEMIADMQCKWFR